MKKNIFLLLIFIFVLFVVCGQIVRSTQVNDSNVVNSRSNFNKDSFEYKEKNYALHKAVGAYTKSLKYSNEKIPMTGSGVAKSFSKRVSGVTYQNGNILNVRGETWEFIITGSCKPSDNCRIIVGKTYTVKLWTDEDGYLTTDNPSSPY